MLILVQLSLVLAVLILAFALMRGGMNARHLAIRRILLVLFALAAACSIFFPDLLSAASVLLGVGRGTDLLLYGAIVAFLVFIATTYQRFRKMEGTLTLLARRLALDEAEAPSALSKRVRPEQQA